MHRVGAARIGPVTRRLRLLGLVSLAALVTLVRPAPASAWDFFGHHVVCAVAWDGMDEASRRGAAELLLRAPVDGDLASLMPPGPRPRSIRERELFIKSCAWADIVRDGLFEARKEKYDEPAWHYVNRFWRTSASGAGYEALPERGTLGELVERLNEARRRVGDGDDGRPPGERALDLAWALHLAGDVHQPLHSSGRVTDREPDGDRGGNDFALDDPRAWNLHSFWDGILRRSRAKYHSESYFTWVARVAVELEELHPRASLTAEVQEDDVEAWSKAAAEVAMKQAYPPTLARGAAPSREYERRVFAPASRQAALAGYRIAKILNAVFR